MPRRWTGGPCDGPPVGHAPRGLGASVADARQPPERKAQRTRRRTVRRGRSGLEERVGRLQRADRHADERMVGAAGRTRRADAPEASLAGIAGDAVPGRDDAEPELGQPVGRDAAAVRRIVGNRLLLGEAADFAKASGARNVRGTGVPRSRDSIGGPRPPRSGTCPTSSRRLVDEPPRWAFGPELLLCLLGLSLLLQCLLGLLLLAALFRVLILRRHASPPCGCDETLVLNVHARRGSAGRILTIPSSSTSTT